MGENSKIEWCDHTFNPWVGCTKLAHPTGSACDFCYAAAWAKRTGHSELWEGERRRTSATNWQQPIKWDRAAAAAGVRYRVFCASLADVFDNQVPERWRHDLWHRIAQTRHLDWLLLTKRPENIKKMLPDPKTGTPDWGEGWPNVWLGATAEDQARYDHRWGHLRQVPARIRFISYEPAIGPMLPGMDAHEGETPDWIIAGGESGGKARPSNPKWFRDLRDDCAHLGIAFLFKQWGEWAEGVENWKIEATGPKCAFWDPHDNRWVLFDQPPRQMARYGLEHRLSRVGKKAAGRLLDGALHDGFPQVRP
jgi:protein gp37